MIIIYNLDTHPIKYFSQVIRFDPETSTILETINVDAAFVTSVVFGGENLDNLYVATAIFEKTSDKYPHAGYIFEAKSMSISGRRSDPYIITDIAGYDDDSVEQE